MRIKTFLFVIILFPTLLLGCAPDYPVSEEHNGATVPDCQACHFVEREGRNPPRNHWNSEMIATDYQNCLRCHEQARP